MIIGRASPVAITYRPNSKAMYQQNKASTKYINIPIKNTISNRDLKNNTQIIQIIEYQ